MSCSMKVESVETPYQTAENANTLSRCRGHFTDCGHVTKSGFRNYIHGVGFTILLDKGRVDVVY